VAEEAEDGVADAASITSAAIADPVR